MSVALARAYATTALRKAAWVSQSGFPCDVHRARFAGLNVVLTPSIASASVATRRARVTCAIDNLIAALETGAVPHFINPDAWWVRVVDSSSGMQKYA